MRWNSLFDDLESQLERELTSEARELRGEQERHRLGGLRMLDRIAALAEAGASVGTLRLALLGGEFISVTPLAYGADWFSAMLTDRAGLVIVPLASIAGVTLSGVQVGVSLAPGASPSLLAQRLTLAVVLRDLCRRRLAVEVVLADATLHGTIDRVGVDHVDVALHEPGSARRDSAVTECRLVPLAALLLLRI